MDCDVKKLREIFDRGLCAGVQRDSQVCIEAAISMACGEGVSDEPTCVALPDREYSIGINDAPWSSPQARSEALWPLALAQLGTAGTDRQPWVKEMLQGTIRKVLPIALRAAGLEAEAKTCEEKGDIIAVRAAQLAGAFRQCNSLSEIYASVSMVYSAAVTEKLLTSSFDVSTKEIMMEECARYIAGAARAARSNVGDAVLKASVAVALEAYEKTK